MADYFIKRTGDVWVVTPLESLGRITAGQLRINTKVVAGVTGLLCSGVLRTNNVISLGTSEATVDVLHIGREQQLPGKVNDLAMRDWCLTRDQETGAWRVWLANDFKQGVLATDVEIDCELVSNGPVLHCRAEMLVNGSTNRGALPGIQKRIKLRTLTVHDQRIDIEKITMFGTASL